MCTISCAKILLIIFNSLLWLCGAALIAGGIVLKVHPTIISFQSVVNISTSHPYVSYAALIFIAVGAVAFVVGFFGCCGALKQQQLCLFVYALLLVVIMAVEVAAAVLVVIYRHQAEQMLKTEMIDSLEQHFAEDEVFSKFQFQRQCCGVVNYTDYIGSKWYNQSRANNTGEYVPRTCCVKTEGSVWSNISLVDETGCQNHARNLRVESQYLNVEGCYDRVADWVKKHTLIMLIMAAVVVVIEMLGLSMACCLRNRLLETPDSEKES